MTATTGSTLAQDDESSAAEKEIEILLAASGELILSTGQQIRIKRLKARQFFALLRIITRGGAKILSTIQWGDIKTPEGFASQMIALIVFSVPEAEEPTIDFIISMVEMPVEEEERIALIRTLTDLELDDMLDIIETIILREKEDLVGLGKRIKRYADLAQKTGQMPGGKNEDKVLLEDGQEPSTSSPGSMGGMTKKSSTSRSRASGK